MRGGYGHSRRDCCELYQQVGGECAARGEGKLRCGKGDAACGLMEPGGGMAGGIMNRLGPVRPTCGPAVRPRVAPSARARADLLMVEPRNVFTWREGSGGADCEASSMWHGDVAGDMPSAAREQKRHRR